VVYAPRRTGAKKTHTREVLEKLDDLASAPGEL
jgi:hypothetical protein